MNATIEFGSPFDRALLYHPPSNGCLDYTSLREAEHYSTRRSSGTGFAAKVAVAAAVAIRLFSILTTASAMASAAASLEAVGMVSTVAVIAGPLTPSEVAAHPSCSPSTTRLNPQAQLRDTLSPTAPHNPIYIGTYAQNHASKQHPIYKHTTRMHGVVRLPLTAPHKTHTPPDIRVHIV